MTVSRSEVATGRALLGSMSLLALLLVVPNAIYSALVVSSWSTLGAADDAIAVGFLTFPLLAGLAVWILRRHASVTGSRRVGEALLGLSA
jgi:hypothetical protein